MRRNSGLPEPERADRQEVGPRAATVGDSVTANPAHPDDIDLPRFVREIGLLGARADQPTWRMETGVLSPFSGVLDVGLGRSGRLPPSLTFLTLTDLIALGGGSGGDHPDRRAVSDLDTLERQPSTQQPSESPSDRDVGMGDRRPLKVYHLLQGDRESGPTPRTHGTEERVQRSRVDRAGSSDSESTEPASGDTSSLTSSGDGRPPVDAEEPESTPQNPTDERFGEEQPSRLSGRTLTSEQRIQHAGSSQDPHSPEGVDSIRELRRIRPGTRMTAIRRIQPLGHARRPRTVLATGSIPTRGNAIDAPGAVPHSSTPTDRPKRDTDRRTVQTIAAQSPRTTEQSNPQTDSSDIRSSREINPAGAGQNESGGMEIVDRPMRTANAPPASGPDGDPSIEGVHDGTPGAGPHRFRHLVSRKNADADGVATSTPAGRPPGVGSSLQPDVGPLGEWHDIGSGSRIPASRRDTGGMRVPMTVIESVDAGRDREGQGGDDSRSSGPPSPGQEGRAGAEISESAVVGERGSPSQRAGDRSAGEWQFPPSLSLEGGGPDTRFIEELYRELTKKMRIENDRGGL